MTQRCHEVVVSILQLMAEKSPMNQYPMEVQKYAVDLKSFELRKNRLRHVQLISKTLKFDSTSRKKEAPSKSKNYLCYNDSVHSTSSFLNFRRRPKVSCSFLIYHRKDFLESHLHIQVSTMKS